MWSTNPSPAVYKFCNGTAPFNTLKITRCLEAYTQLQRLHTILQGEARNLSNATELPGVADEISAPAAATINVVSNAIAILLDPSEVGHLCLALDAGRISESRFEEGIIELGANMLAMAFNASYTAAGIAAELSPVDYPHELVANSAQRLRALALEVNKVIGDGAMIALLS